MREIKFRGREVDTGRVVYGDLLTNRRGQYFIWGENSDEVDPETVAQLIGHDSNGREVYEGDKLIGDAGYIWTAKFILPIVKRLTLVEAK